MERLARFADQQWRLFEASFDREAIVHKCKPASVLAGIGAALAIVAVAAWVEPFASAAQFRAPWLPISLVLFAGAASLLYGRLQGRGRLASLLTLTDTAALTCAAALCVGLTSTPVNDIFAIFLGGMLVSSQSRDFALTPVFAATVLIFGLAVAALVSSDPFAVLFVAGSCTFALFASHSTRVQRRLERQAVGLASALETSEQVAKNSMELALSTTLLGIASFFHEMRNMQAAVHLNLRVLADECKELDSQALQDAVAAHEKERAILNEAVQNLKRPEHADQAAFDLHALLLEDGVNELSHGLEIAIGSSVPHFQVSSDARDFQLILRNLLRNARQAGASKVEISCELAPSASSVQLTVRDNGGGLPEVDQPSLFQPFTSFGKHEGTGLGLYLTQRSVELMGGQIEASNGEQGGAEFTIRLPGRLLRMASSED